MMLAGSAAMAGSMSLTHFKPQVMPVLVAVNAKGHVTKVLPSTELSPTLQRLLAKNLNEWIARPAMVKGRAVASQMIVNVALRAKPRADGRYDVNFAYVSMLRSPFGGAVHWAWKDGRELALVSDSGMRAPPRWCPPPRNFPPPRVMPRDTMRAASGPAPRPVTPPSRR
jgi:hypothetical protein